MNYIEKLCNTIAKTTLETFENLSIEDVNMYQLGYNKAIEDFIGELQEVIDEHGTQYVMMYMKERAKQLKR